MRTERKAVILILRKEEDRESDWWRRPEGIAICKRLKDRWVKAVELANIGFLIG
jgi:hypothetical protein